MTEDRCSSVMSGFSKFLVSPHERDRNFLVSMYTHMCVMVHAPAYDCDVKGQP